MGYGDQARRLMEQLLATWARNFNQCVTFRQALAGTEKAIRPTGVGGR
jgi:hypothetical protein